MSPRMLAFAAAVILANLPTRALEVSGTVKTKVGDPIAGAKVCIKSDLNKCVTSNLAGEFNLSSANGIIKTFGNANAFSMKYQRGQLILQTPFATKARVEWINVSGKLMIPQKEMSLNSGRNFLSVPEKLPQTGVFFIRVHLPDYSVTWKAQMMGSRGIAPSKNENSTSRRGMALSKTSAIAALLVTKTGYFPETYIPETDPEPDAQIFMRATDDAGASLSGTFTSKVISIDRTKNIFIDESVDAVCNGATIARDTTRDTNNYAIRGGKLLVWSAGECKSQVFTGTSTDIVGTWTLEDRAADLPADLRAGCDSTLSDSEEFEGVYSGKVTITESTFNANLTIDFCPGEMFGPLLFSGSQRDTSLSLVKNTCKQIIFENAAQEKATMNFSVDGDSLRIGFIHNTSTCNGSLNFGISGKDPVCPEGEGIVPFLACLETTGFSSRDTISIAAAKTTASSPLPISKERKGLQSRRSIFSKYGWNFKTFR